MLNNLEIGKKVEKVGNIVKVEKVPLPFILGARSQCSQITEHMYG